MALNDERQYVLRMIEEGNVSPREGARLLMALGEIGDDKPLRGEPQTVLRMIAEEKISVDDGTRLLIALGGLNDDQPAAPAPAPAAAAPAAAPPPAALTRDDGMLVHITVKRNDGKMVRLSIPLEGARMVLPLFDLPHAALLGEYGRDVNRVRDALRSGEPGEVMDFHDADSGHSIHIAIG